MEKSIKMPKKNIVITFLFFWMTLLPLHTQIKDIHKLSDAPNDTIVVNHQTFPTTYKKALQQWKTVGDINHWIQSNFKYSMERAKKLAENSLNRNKTTIYAPEEFYQIKKGVCVDLSRFTVETINKIDSTKHAQYLMINFEPITIDGKIIRKHWIALYQDAHGYYLLGDSKRPGHIDGPYEKIDDFITIYEKYRKRKINSWKVLPNYKKARKKKTYKRKKKS